MSVAMLTTSASSSGCGLSVERVEHARDVERDDRIDVDGHRKYWLQQRG
jgi:hypothetical protein